MWIKENFLAVSLSKVTYVAAASLSGDHAEREANYQGLHRAAFWSQRVLVALPASHRFVEQDSVHWTELRAETFLLAADDPGSELRDMVLGPLAALAGVRTSGCAVSPANGS